MAVAQILDDIKMLAQLKMEDQSIQTKYDAKEITLDEYEKETKEVMIKIQNCEDDMIKRTKLVHRNRRQIKFYLIIDDRNPLYKKDMTFVSKEDAEWLGITYSQSYYLQLNDGTPVWWMISNFIIAGDEIESIEFNNDSNMNIKVRKVKIEKYH